MEFPTIVFQTFLLLLVGLVAAAPPQSPVARQTASTTQLTFTGAGASFSITANVDGQTFSIPNAISVDSISQEGTASCTFVGVNNAQLTVLGANTGATLAPPQTVVSGTCTQ